MLYWWSKPTNRKFHSSPNQRLSYAVRYFGLGVWSVAARNKTLRVHPAENSSCGRWLMLCLTQLLVVFIRWHNTVYKYPSVLQVTADGLFTRTENPALVLEPPATNSHECTATLYSAITMFDGGEKLFPQQPHPTARKLWHMLRRMLLALFEHCQKQHLRFELPLKITMNGSRASRRLACLEALTHTLENSIPRFSLYTWVAYWLFHRLLTLSRYHKHAFCLSINICVCVCV